MNSTNSDWLLLIEVLDKICGDTFVAASLVLAIQEWLTEPLDSELERLKTQFLSED